jgi:predicted Zn-dependent protease with MMP-like domain
MPMDRLSFIKLVERALAKLPGKFRGKLRNIIVEVEDDPAQEVLDDLGIENGTLYGLYQGVPLTKREWNYGNMLPDRIVIYQGPIERVARTDEDVEKIVRDTVIHEIGHYFGFDDAALYAIENEKQRKMN